MFKTALALVFLTILCAACGPARARPVSFPDPDVSCPGGRISWNLEIRDRRADREAEEKVTASIREAIQKSFPGCRWAEAGSGDAGTIVIEVHRFASRFDGVAWEAAVEWTVAARDGGGRIVTEFGANEEVSRPNYRGTDNETQSLSEAFSKAVERTSKGLAAIPRTLGVRPPEGTENRVSVWEPNPDGRPNSLKAGRLSPLGAN